MMLALPFALVCISDRRKRCYGLRVVLPAVLCPVQVFVDRFEKNGKQRRMQSPLRLVCESISHCVSLDSSTIRRLLIRDCFVQVIARNINLRNTL